jgi:hypothetical protein
LQLCCAEATKGFVTEVLNHAKFTYNAVKISPYHVRHLQKTIQLYTIFI